MIGFVSNRALVAGPAVAVEQIAWIVAGTAAARTSEGRTIHEAFISSKDRFPSICCLRRILCQGGEVSHVVHSYGRHGPTRSLQKSDRPVSAQEDMLQFHCLQERQPVDNHRRLMQFGIEVRSGAGAFRGPQPRHGVHHEQIASDDLPLTPFVVPDQFALLRGPRPAEERAESAIVAPVKTGNDPVIVILRYDSAIDPLRQVPVLQDRDCLGMVCPGKAPLEQGLKHALRLVLVGSDPFSDRVMVPEQPDSFDLVLVCHHRVRIRTAQTRTARGWFLARCSTRPTR